MVLDSKLLQLRGHFGVEKPEDWQSVYPEWILKQDGIGPVTLNHLRMYLAARGLTLKNDRTPEYWQENLSSAKLAQQISFTDTATVGPFTVLVDSREQDPFTFKGFYAGS